MICKACAEAAANGVQGEEGHRGYGCKGDCDCQHRVGTLEAMFSPETVAQIRAAGSSTDPEG